MPILEKVSESFVNEATFYNLTIDKLVTKMAKAIENRYYIGFYYESDDDGVKKGYRFVEPYTLGKGFKGSKDQVKQNAHYLSAYLIFNTRQDRNKNINKYNRKSTSKSKKPIGWRLYRLDRIHSIEVFENRIPEKRKGYNNTDGRFIQKIASLDL